ncbi:MAG: glycosyltransferase family 4 protein [bacterium]
MFNQRTKIIYFITKSNWGGAQRYVYDLATNLPASNYDVKVALGGHGRLKEKLEEEKIPVIQLHRLNRDVKLFDDVRVFFDLVKILKEEKPDIIHLNSSKISALGALAAKVTGISKVVFTSHGWAFNEDRPFFAKFLIRAIYFLTLIFADSIITVSEGAARQIVNWPFNKKKVTVVHNGIAAPRFDSLADARASLAARLPSPISSKINPETFWLGSIGELHHIKGHIYALKALENILKSQPNLSFIYLIIGGGEMKERLEKEIEKRGLKDHVYLTGAIEDAVKLLQAFNIFIFPSLSEGLPYAVIEAGMAKLPCIASNVGGIPEIIENERSGLLLSPKNVIELESAILKLIKEKSLRENFANNLFENTKVNFSLEKMLEKTESVYRH